MNRGSHISWDRNDLLCWSDPFFGVYFDGLFEFCSRCDLHLNLCFVTTRGWRIEDRHTQRAMENFVRIAAGKKGLRLSFHLFWQDLDIIRALYGTPRTKVRGTWRDPAFGGIIPLAVDHGHPSDIPRRRDETKDEGGNHYVPDWIIAAYTRRYVNIIRTLGHTLRMICLSFVPFSSAANDATLKVFKRALKELGIEEKEIERTIAEISDKRRFSLRRELITLGNFEVVFSDVEKLGRGEDFLGRVRAAEKGDASCLAVKRAAITDREGHRWFPPMNYPESTITDKGRVAVRSVLEPKRILLRSTLDKLDPMVAAEIRSSSPAEQKQSIRAVAMFSGMGNYRAFENFGRRLYDLAIADVCDIYEQAMSMVHSGRRRKKFFYAQKEKDPFLFYVTFLVNNLAYFAYLNYVMKAAQLPVSILALAGESAGITIAAIAAGSVSLKEYIAYARDRGLYQNEEMFPLYIVMLQGSDFTVAGQDLQSRFKTYEPFQYQSDDVMLVYIDEAELEDFLRHVEQRYAGRLHIVKISKVKRFVRHSRLLAPMRQKAERILEQRGIAFRDPALPIISNTGKGYLHTADEVRDAALSILDKPMNSRDTVRCIEALNPDALITVGPQDPALRQFVLHRIKIPIVPFLAEKDFVQAMHGLSKGKKASSSSPLKNKEAMKRRITAYLVQHQQRIWEIVARYLREVPHIGDHKVREGTICADFSYILAKTLAEIFGVSFNGLRSSAFMIVYGRLQLFEDVAVSPHWWIAFYFRGKPLLVIDPTRAQIDKSYVEQIFVDDYDAETGHYIGTTPPGVSDWFDRRYAGRKELAIAEQTAVEEIVFSTTTEAAEPLRASSPMENNYVSIPELRPINYANDGTLHPHILSTRGSNVFAMIP